MSDNYSKDHENIKDEILIELIQVKNLMSLSSKTSIRDGEQIHADEINSLFIMMQSQVQKIITKFENIM